MSGTVDIVDGKLRFVTCYQVERVAYLSWARRCVALIIFPRVNRGILKARWRFNLELGAEDRNVVPITLFGALAIDSWDTCSPDVRAVVFCLNGGTQFVGVAVIIFWVRSEVSCCIPGGAFVRKCLTRTEWDVLVIASVLCLRGRAKHLSEDKNNCYA
ncbi:hypothetical protein XarjCFBP7645_02515 [Xanthomonas arboricola]|uniref:Uncharacterized protein n=1 Tax=Xanthomonas arboricola TaxID=56448 RepID=A0A2S7AH70_9XANT|nr:hypothetical protein XarjCFBP7645_02515 [Xanthomonas arboricola]